MQKGYSTGKFGYASSLGSATRPGHAMTEVTRGRKPSQGPPTTYQVISNAVPQDVELH